VSETSCLDDATIARLADDQVAAGSGARLWAHVEGCTNCQARLQQAIAALDDADDELDTLGGSLVDSSIDQDIATGTTFGRYLVLEPLGQGGLGEIYAAYDPELDRRIALKLLRVRSGDATALNLLRVRLVREARALARLQHPNAVSVFDVGSAHDRVFVAMELVTGRTFRAWLRDTHPEWSKALEVLLPAGRALAAAHAAGLIHRDFKPTNVMVSNAGETKVLDFGLALGVERRRAMPKGVRSGDGQLDALDGEAIDEPGSLLGTPGYMAPEQFGAAAPLDPRIDQFAFCVTLYEACYGQRPFRGTTVAEIRDATVEGRRLRPPTDRDVPSWLAAAIDRGLQTDPGDRFDSMEDLLAALQPADSKARRPWIYAAILAVLLVVATTSALGLARDSSAEVDEIVTLTNAARAAAAKAYFVYPPADDPDEDTAYSVIQRLDALDGALEDQADEAAGELRSEFATTLVRLGDRYWDEDGGRPFAVDYYAMALLFNPDDLRARERSLMTVGALANLEQRAKESSFTESELRAAETLTVLAEPDEERRLAKIQRLYANSEGKLGVTTSHHIERLIGKPLERRGEAAMSKTPPRNPPETPEPSLEVIEIDDTDGTDPIPPAESPDPSPKPADKPDDRDPKAAAARVQAARTAFKANRLDQAEGLFHQALELDSRSLGALAGLAELHFERGQYRLAVKFAKRAVRRSPRSADLHLLLGDAHFKVYEYADARRAYDKAKSLGHPDAAGRIRRLEDRIGKK
jgi:tetratricopeptide (TPR) repeat protein